MRRCPAPAGESGNVSGMKSVRIIDSHTAGEPMRVVIEGGPDLGHEDLAERRNRFRADYDHYRAGIVNEPRDSDVIEGALLCEPVDATCATGMIFFNNDADPLRFGSQPSLRGAISRTRRRRTSTPRSRLPCSPWRHSAAAG
jgi:hypothetical protein